MAEKQRVMITLPDETLAMIDEYCGRYGGTRSTFVQTAVGEKLYQMDLSSKAVTQLVASTVAKVDFSDFSGVPSVRSDSAA